MFAGKAGAYPSEPSFRIKTRSKFFYFRSDRMYVMHLKCSIPLRPNLRVENTVKTSFRLSSIRYRAYRATLLFASGLGLPELDYTVPHCDVALGSDRKYRLAVKYGQYKQPSLFCAITWRRKKNVSNIVYTKVNLGESYSGKGILGELSANGRLRYFD
jgi:hypothetical protein